MLSDEIINANVLTERIDQYLFETVRLKMEFKQDRNSNITFSLHDTRIKSVIFKDNKLILKADKIFKYTKDGEKIYSGEIIFDGSDIDEYRVFIFDKVVYEGKFSGNAVGMREYMKKYLDVEFEIITEGYYGYCTTYTGWIRENGKEPVSGIMYIWNSGDMVYHINE